MYVDVRSRECVCTHIRVRASVCVGVYVSVYVGCFGRAS